MANHPSRGWRRRGAAAAEAHIDALFQVFGAKQPAGVVLTTAEFKDYIRSSFQYGFSAGRLDVLNSRRKRKSDVHTG